MVGAIDDVAADDWDACAGDDNPFVCHAFLTALEDSHSVGAESGWLPRHLIAEDAVGTVVAVAPMYLKSNSYGEYVFDHAWADAFRRMGGRYYPKLQISVPFTPVPGPRLLVRPDGDGLAGAALAQAMIELAQRLEVSSIHVTFAAEADCATLERFGFLRRKGYQFHWINQDYTSFDDFLAALNSRKRKALRKERRDATASGIVLRALSGDELSPAHWDAFYRFYRSTSDRKWGQPYLTREFFDLLGARLGDRVVLILAEDRGQYVAGALNLRGPDALYGRNWGCLGEYPFLHFETCYYQAIDYAIAHGLKRVEAGAQGEHKLQRGYLPSATWSAHWIANPSFRSAVADYLRRETHYVDHDIAALAEHSPFRQSEDGA